MGLVYNGVIRNGESRSIEHGDKSVITKRQGMDILDIAVVVQWRVTCQLIELWQRWGHAARACKQMGTAILFAEKDLFDDVWEERKIR